MNERRSSQQGTSNEYQSEHSGVFDAIAQRCMRMSWLTRSKNGARSTSTITRCPTRRTPRRLVPHRAHAVLDETRRLLSNSSPRLKASHPATGAALILAYVPIFSDCKLHARSLVCCRLTSRCPACRLPLQSRRTLNVTAYQPAPTQNSWFIPNSSPREDTPAVPDGAPGTTKRAFPLLRMKASVE
jgi:hypothetical protein